MLANRKQPLTASTMGTLISREAVALPAGDDPVLIKAPIALAHDALAPLIIWPRQGEEQGYRGAGRQDGRALRSLGSQLDG
jgi:hypothetical protein